MVIAHAGKQHSYQLANALLKSGNLRRFYTSGYISSILLQKLLEKAGDNFWNRRFLNGLGGDFVRSNWRFELKEFFISKLYGTGKRMNTAVYNRDVIFDKHLANKLPKESPDAFWGFQGSCRESLAQAQNLGWTTIYDFPSAHYEFGKRILEEERRLHPEWNDSFAQLSLPKSYEQRLYEEPQLSNHIVVSSTFSKNTIVSSGLPDSKISLIPLGTTLGKIEQCVEQGSRKPLKLLYVGRVTQAKGIVYLLEAISKIPKKEICLTIIGHVEGSGQGLKSYQDKFELLRPVSQDELYRTYKNYDALVLPSLFEGFGLVIIEAMAAGLPVITTPNTMGPDVIRQGENGIIVPIRDVSALTAALESLLNMSDQEFSAMRDAAKSSANKYNWSTYSQRVAEFVSGL